MKNLQKNHKKSKMSESYAKVYFDGGSKTNNQKISIGSRAGGACYLPETKTVFYQRATPDPETKKETNNRGELTGLILALSNTKGNVSIYGDSLYALKIGAKEWKNKNNHDLVKQIHELTKDRKIIWNHVKAHSGIVENEICDEYATKAQNLNDLNVVKIFLRE